MMENQKKELTQSHICPRCDVGTVYYRWDEDGKEKSFCDAPPCIYPRIPPNEPNGDGVQNRTIVISEGKSPSSLPPA